MPEEVDTALVRDDLEEAQAWSLARSGGCGCTF